ncbi:MAG: ATP-dependent metallopeptidase FtsH/Yme1/Tma family protein [Actinomycetia bacterium]|nr:ATP-dependent metallopeptidase FtsH/Yme1/Tma family protein [Actinomycetes bacterium]
MLLAAAVIIVLFAGWNWLQRGPEVSEVNLGEFRQQLEAGDIDTATIKARSNAVVGELDDGTRYQVDYPDGYEEQLTSELLAAGIDPDTDPEIEPLWVSLLWTLLPILLLIGVFVYFINSMQGGGGKVMSFGKAKARRFSKDQPTVTFADVAGADEAVEELREIKDFLENPAKFHAIGAKIPKGVLLYGPPGTGKTLLARAVAGEAGAPFFSISGSDFVEMFVGVGASRVRDLFEQAKQTAPAIIFVDEIDAVGRHRGAGLGGGHDEREQTLNQLLVEMDGFDLATGVILIAATNRPDILDPALLRPGRFDRQIVVDQPDLEGRHAILKVHSDGKPLAADVDLRILARRTPGFTGADLANLMNEAALLSARRGLDVVSMIEMEDAIDRVLAGPERKNRAMSEKEKRVIAYHEAGHALVGHVLPNTDPIHKVSIVARGRALGWTLALPNEDKYLRTQSELLDQLAMLLGGRTAEELIFGDPTTGAADDIERVTDLARSMITEWGMSSALGLRKLGQSSGEVFLGHQVGHERDYSDDLAASIDVEVRRLVDEAHDEAREILTLHRATLDHLADALVEHETLDDAKLAELFRGITLRGQESHTG